jgi:hypothetical protein
MVRAKFTVTSIKKQFYKTAAGEVVEHSAEIVLTPQYDSTIEEDRRYAKATPSGLISLCIDNPSAIEYLKPGEAFYVDFTRVE